MLFQSSLTGRFDESIDVKHGDQKVTHHLEVRKHQDKTLKSLPPSICQSALLGKPVPRTVDPRGVRKSVAGRGSSG